MQRDKIRKLTDQTKKTLLKKGGVVSDLARRITDLGGDVPAYKEIPMPAAEKDLEDKAEMFVALCRRQVASRDAYIGRLKAIVRELAAPHVTVTTPEEITVRNFPGTQVVRVENHPEVQAVEVRAFPDIQKVQIEGAPDVQKVQIENHPEVQTVKVENAVDMKTEVNFPDVQKVHLVNPPEAAEKASAWVPTVVTAAVAALSGLAVALFRKTLGHTFVVKLEDDERLKPLPVIVVDSRGRPVNFAALGGYSMPGSVSGGATKPATTIGSGRTVVSSAGTATKLTSAVTVCRKVTVTALDTNGDRMFIGGSNVKAAAGFEVGVLLNPTGSVEIDIDDVSKVWVDAGTSGNGVTYTYVR